MEKEMVFGKRSGGARDIRLDNVKGLLITLVVAGHFLLPLYRTRFVTACIYAIYVFHMPCFVMLSGYYAKSVYKNGRFRPGKLIELLWLYFVFKMLVNVTEGMLAGHIPLFPDFFHESGAPWYLLAMLLWYASVPLIHRIKAPAAKLLCSAAILLLVVFGKYYIGCNDFLSMDRVLSFAPFFYIGYFCSEKEYKGFVRSKAGRLMAVAGLILIAVVFFTTYDIFFRYHLVVYGADYSRYDSALWSYIWLINLIWYAVAFLISVFVIVAAPAARIPVLTTVGQNTLQIYIIHRLIRDLWQYYGVYERINPHNKAEVIMVLAFSVVLTAFLGNRFFAAGFAWIRKLPVRLLNIIGIHI